MLISSAAVVAAIVFLIYIAFKHVTDKRQLPPGPKPHPIMGNARDFPPAQVPEYQHWLKHKDLYGPISSVSVMGKTIVLVHDRKMAHDLLNSSASKTSGRPTMMMAGKLCGYESIVLCQGYTPVFRHYRKLLHKELGTKVSAAQFRGTQERETAKQLVRALNHPEGWLEHFSKTAGATSLKTTYDYNVEPDKPDALVGLIEKMMKSFSVAAIPMAWPVDVIPALQHWPESFPGGGFKTTARKFKKQVMDGVHAPYLFVQRQMAAQDYEPSFTSRLIQQCALDNGTKESLSPEDEEAIIWSSASLYGAAADTTVITLTTWTLAMIMFPEVQRRAQEEIDRVVGTDRLPTFDDRENLPYIDAIVKEALRWWPIAAMGFPHTADEELEYEGYHIPKGAMIMPAVWSFMHDPDVYANPEKFDPERFLAPRSEPDPCSEVFGYGRRVCPGQHFADAGLFINIAQSAACFNMSKAVGKDGKVIEPNVKSKPGVLHYPTEFQFNIAPRSEKHVEIIKRLETQVPVEGGDSHLLQLG